MEAYSISLGTGGGGLLHFSGAREGGVISDLRGTRGVGHFRNQGHKRGGSVQVAGGREGRVNSGCTGTRGEVQVRSIAVA